MLDRQVAPGGEYPRHVAARVLKNDFLQAEVMEPNDPGRYFRGVRFSPVADILRVVMAGKDFLFSPGAHDPLTDNCGLRMEFDLGTGPTAPPGFALHGRPTFICPEQFVLVELAPGSSKEWSRTYKFAFCNSSAGQFQN